MSDTLPKTSTQTPIKKSWLCRRRLENVTLGDTRFPFRINDPFWLPLQLLSSQSDEKIGYNAATIVVAVKIVVWRIAL